MGTDEIPRGSRFVCAEFDQGVVPTHPRTGEPVPPPLSCTFLCPPESVGWAKARLASLASSTGWRAEIFEQAVYREDMEGSDAT